MATKKISKPAIKKVPFIDLGPWNFIIFITLGLILVVFVSAAINERAQDLKVKAGYACPDVTKLPRPEDCTGGEWKYKRNAQGCPSFVCNSVELEEGSFRRSNPFPSRPAPVLR